MLLRSEGWLVNAKRVNRLYREMGLQLRKIAEAEGTNSGPLIDADRLWIADLGAHPLERCNDIGAGEAPRTSIAGT